MSTPRVVFPAIALAVGLAGATSAHAQNLNQPPPPPGPRVGWEVGFGLYGGEINCQNENGDFCDGVTEAGASGLTVTEVRGYGRQKGKTEVYRGAEYEVKLLPKVKLEIAASDDLVQPIIDAIIRTANSGKIGDGKVFVMDLEQALRIRTGEAGAAAIAG